MHTKRARFVWLITAYFFSGCMGAAFYVEPWAAPPLLRAALGVAFGGAVSALVLFLIWAGGQWWRGGE